MLVFATKDSVVLNTVLLLLLPAVVWQQAAEPDMVLSCAGFLQQFAGVCRPDEPEKNMATVVEQLSGGRTPSRVLCCGHSLGGALATLGAHLLLAPCQNFYWKAWLHITSCGSLAYAQLSWCSAQTSYASQCCSHAIHCSGCQALYLSCRHHNMWRAGDFTTNLWLSSSLFLCHGCRCDMGCAAIPSGRHPVCHIRES